MDGIESLFGDFRALAELASLTHTRPVPTRPAWAGPARTGKDPRPTDWTRACDQLVNALFGTACYTTGSGMWVHYRKTCTCQRKIR